MISGCFIAKNEGANVDVFIPHLKPFLSEIIVVDGGSTDDTVAKAEAQGCTVFRREFDNFASMRNFSLAKATHMWRFTLDFDEVISSKFAQMAPSLIQADDVDCYQVKILHYRAEDKKIMSIGWKRVLFKNYAIFWGDLHERIISLKYEKKIEDDDVFIEEYKSEEHQYKIFKKYKTMLSDMYNKYKSQDQILLMNRVSELLLPQHNDGVRTWIRDSSRHGEILMSKEELVNGLA